jgi:copper homeostasis protein
MKLEICVDTVAATTLAARAGVARIELCAALSEGGLTPSQGLMKVAAGLSVESHAMIRPRAGGFIYSSEEVAAMLDDIAAAKEAGLAGVVFGALTRDGALDLPILSELIAAARPLEVTLHRAIDMTQDPFLALEQAIDLGFQRILTSGQKETALEGVSVIAKLVAQAGGRIEIMAGSGINVENVEEIIQKTGISDVHSSCATLNEPPDYFGFDGACPVKSTDRATIDKMHEVLRQKHN